MPIALAAAYAEDGLPLFVGERTLSTKAACGRVRTEWGTSPATQKFAFCGNKHSLWINSESVALLLTDVAIRFAPQVLWRSLRLRNKDERSRL